MERKLIFVIKMASILCQLYLKINDKIMTLHKC